MQTIPSLRIGKDRQCSARFPASAKQYLARYRSLVFVPLILYSAPLLNRYLPMSYLSAFGATAITYIVRGLT